MAAEDVQTVPRRGQAEQALAKIAAPRNPDLTTTTVSPGASGSGAAAPAPPPAPTPGTALVPQGPVQRLTTQPPITVNSAGAGMTQADIANRAALGNTSDVAQASARARLSSVPTPPVVATPAAPPVAQPGTGLVPQGNAQTILGTTNPVPNANGTLYTNPAGGASPNLASAATPQAPGVTGDLDATIGARARAAKAARAAATGAAPAAESAAAPAVEAAVPGAVPAASTVGPIASVASRARGALTSVANYGRGIPAAAIAGEAITDAPKIAQTGTERYANRFGLPGAAGRSVAGDLALRTGGAISDVAAGLADSVNNTLVNPFLAVGGLQPLPSARDYLTSRDGGQPQAGTQAPTADAVQAGPPRADFSNVQHGVGPTVPDTGPIVPRGTNAANPATWSPSARAALSSTTPGTAVINGRVVSPKEIADLANRNVVQSGAPALGVAYSEATGGKTPELGSTGTGGGSGFTAQDRAAQLAAIESMPDSRTPANKQQQARDSLVRDIRSAISSGKRKTAGRLIELLSAQSGAQNADTAAANAARERRTPQQDELTAAQADEATANAGLARQRLTAGQIEENLRNNVINASSPAAAQSAAETLARVTGRNINNEQPKRQIGSYQLPSPDGGITPGQKFNYDLQTGEPILPKGFQPVYVDKDGNRKRGPLQQ